MAEEASTRWELLSAASGRSQAWLRARDVRGEPQLRAVEGDGAGALYRRMWRAVSAGQPVAQVVGETSFFGRSFWVTPDVLIPRSDSECLIHQALAFLGGHPGSGVRPMRILDLGTGSGCLAITLGLEARARGWKVDVLGTDLSESALRVARNNGCRHGLALTWLRGDWLEALPASMPAFDLIVSNPPYLSPADPHLLDRGLQCEPLLALVGQNQHPDGLSVYRRLAKGLPRWLEPTGALLVEHGWTQQPQVCAILEASGFRVLTKVPDLAGRPRAVFAQL